MISINVVKYARERREDYLEAASTEDGKCLLADGVARRARSLQHL